MANQELSLAVNSQIDSIFRKEFPNEAEYSDCIVLLKTATDAFTLMPMLNPEIKKGQSSRTLGFTIGGGKSGDTYSVFYYKKENDQLNTQMITVVKNQTEKIKVEISGNKVSTREFLLEYYNDFPKFKNAKQDYDKSIDKAKEIIGGLSMLIRGISF